MAERPARPVTTTEEEETPVRGATALRPTVPAPIATTAEPSTLIRVTRSTTRAAATEEEEVETSSPTRTTAEATTTAATTTTPRAVAVTAVTTSAERVNPASATLRTTSIDTAALASASADSSDSSHSSINAGPIAAGVVAAVAAVAVLLLLLGLRLLYRRRAIANEQQKIAERYAKEQDESFEGGVYNDKNEKPQQYGEKSALSPGSNLSAPFSPFAMQHPNSSGSIRSFDSSAPLFPSEGSNIRQTVPAPSSPMHPAFHIPIHNSHLVAQAYPLSPLADQSKSVYPPTPEASKQYPVYDATLIENPFTGSSVDRSAFGEVDRSPAESQATSPIDTAFTSKVAEAAKRKTLLVRQDSVASQDVSYGIAMEEPPSRSTPPRSGSRATVKSNREEELEDDPSPYLALSPPDEPTIHASKQSVASSIDFNNSSSLTAPQLEQKRLSGVNDWSFLDTMMGDEDEQAKRK